ncbi:MAG: hypothetical protein IBJ11_02895 [Phycisphaerales bacterium]|nr:hypothetical protein [Phycisphaerales bacterium]
MVVRMLSVGLLAWVCSGSALAQAIVGPPQPEASAFRQHKLVTATISGMRDFLALTQLGEFLGCTPRNGPQQFVIPPDKMAALDGLGIPYVVTADDVQQLIEAEAREIARVQADRDSSFFDTYRTYAQINTELDSIVALNPAIATRVSVGLSQGNASQPRQTIYGVRITGPTIPGAPPKPVFIIQGGQHAREWVSPASAMYAIDELVRDYSTDPAIRQVVDSVEFHIIPVVNPDGYVYTWASSNNRLWRKNRRLISGATYGVDLNRNWATAWDPPVSASTNPASDTYRGTAPWSESETAAMRDYINGLNTARPGSIKALIDLHSYSQLILGPWGYTSTVIPPRAAELRLVMGQMESAIDNTFGVPYTAGLGTDGVIYSASGTAQDWPFAVFGALGFTFELRDTGAYGFTLPSSQLRPTAQETFNGLMAMARFIQIRLQMAVPAPPAAASTTGGTNFAVTITELNSYTIAGTPQLLYRVGTSGPFAGANLTGTKPNFTATLPAFPCGSTVQYYVAATASDGAVVTMPADAPATLYSATLPVCPTPGGFSLVTPLDGAAGVNLTPSFTWNASPGASSYTVIIATDPALLNVVASAPGLPGTSWTLPAPSPLAYSSIYYWGVRAVNGSGSTGSTPLSRSLTTFAACPGDADGNRNVGANDLSILLSAFGSCPGDSNYNASVSFDGNPCIGANDLSILLANFGITCSP